MPHVQGMFYTSRAYTATQGEMYVYSRWGIEDEGLRVRREERGRPVIEQGAFRSQEIRETLGGRSENGMAEEKVEVAYPGFGSLALEGSGAGERPSLITHLPFTL